MKRESLHFLLKFIKEPSKVGAILPSSQALANSMTSQIEPSTKPRYILEAGPGTGPITKAINLSPHDHLDLLELDPEFTQILSRKFQHPQISIHQGSILDWNPPHQYDIIISSLPLNALSSEVALQILKKLKSLCKPNATITYFEYMGLPEIKQLFNLDLKYLKKYEFHQEKIWSNFPPALVHHCRIPADA